MSKESSFLNGLWVHPDRSGPEAVLGPLESRVLETMWALAREVSIRDVWTELQPGGAVAYTTVLTICSRLHEKGVLVRRASGRGHLYAPAASREGFLRGIAQRLLVGLARQMRATSAVGLLDELKPKDREAISRLLRTAEPGEKP